MMWRGIFSFCELCNEKILTCLSPFDFLPDATHKGKKRCDVLSAPEQATGGLQAVDSLQWYVFGSCVCFSVS